MLGALREARGLSLASVASLFSGEGHAPAPLTEEERARYEGVTLADAPAQVRGDYPQWLAIQLEAALGEAAANEGAALAERAPVDLRVNILKATREEAQKKIAHLNAEPTPFSPLGLRIRPGADGRGPALSAEPAFVKGLVETQDEGSQLAALLCGAAPGEQILDLCAGGGGKTLALAGQTHNRGQIYAHDADGRRLAPIFARLERASARNVQVRAPKGGADVLADLAGRCDLVLIDALAPARARGDATPTRSGGWLGAIDQRLKEQSGLLSDATRYVKPGGRLAYLTCSLLREENENQIKAFLAAHPNFKALSAEEIVARAHLPELSRFASPHGFGLRFSPLSSGTDGFFVALVQRND